jgi:membrane-associated protease RseP (regulator of RpoE activity)
MRFPSTPASRRLAATACLVLLAVGGSARAVTSASATADDDRAALERRLQAARGELEQAAREVAELSRQLYGEAADDPLRLLPGGSRGSMLGVNLGAGDAREQGVAVAGVSPGGPAEQAGLRAGDVIVAVDGRVLAREAGRSTSAQLVEVMRATPPGRRVKVDYLRDGKRLGTTVTTAPAEPPIVRVIRERFGALPEGALPLPGLQELIGRERGFGALELVPVTPGLGRYFGTDRGLLVVRAPADGALPLQEGDVLQSIGGRTPDNPGHAFRILRSYQPGETVKLGVLRERKTLTLEARMPAETQPRERGPRPPPPLPPPPPGRSDSGPA